MEVVGLPYRDKKLFGRYSLGMKQRLGIANAILYDPELLILDEPTNGLDPIGIAEVRDFIKDLSVERGKTILISSHILSEIQLLADDIGIIALVARMKKGYWLALVFAEIYSFAGLFTSMSNIWKVVYPITAVFNLSGYYQATALEMIGGCVVLVLCVGLSGVVLKGLRQNS